MSPLAGGILVVLISIALGLWAGVLSVHRDEAWPIPLAMVVGTIAAFIITRYGVVYG